MWRTDDFGQLMPNLYFFMITFTNYLHNIVFYGRRKEQTVRIPR